MDDVSCLIFDAYAVLSRGRGRWEAIIDDTKKRGYSTSSFAVVGAFCGWVGRYRHLDVIEMRRFDVSTIGESTQF